MSKKKPSSPPPPSKLSFEEAIEELEQINERIEGGEIGLEETLAAYKRGIALAKRCREILDVAEQAVEGMGQEEGMEGQRD